MLSTILFDLDGTLLKYSQAAFVEVYFKEIQKAFERIGLDGPLSVKAVWAGTKAMLMNDGSMLNMDRFWKTFAEVMNLDDKMLQLTIEMSDKFYENEFNAVKSVAEPSDIPARLIPALKNKGYELVLATNPVFPPAGVTTRLAWIDLSPQDFSLITNYATSTFCKPTPSYYEEIFAKINKTPQQCLMVGNSVKEDICAAALGAQVFLVTDHLENDAEMDINNIRHGSLAELETYLLSLPDIDAL